MTTSTGAALSAALKGRVVEQNDAGYDDARALYNGMIDKRPAAIVYCLDEADVSAAVQFATSNGLTLAVRGGGHNGGGLGSVDGGLVVDLSEMSEIVVEPNARVVHVQGGVLLKDLLAATHEHALTVPVGVIGTTGVGGLTLGGGIGHLTRALGLTIDNLLAASLVLADGSIAQCDAEHEPDLFWAIRGGGGNFGVVTKFTFRCHPASTVLAGPVMYDLDQTQEVMRWYGDFIAGAPEELGGFVSLMSVPPGPPFPEELHLRKVCALVWTQLGEEESDALREARAFGTPLIDGIAAVPLPAWNTAFDPIFPPGDQWYWRGDFIDELPRRRTRRARGMGGEAPIVEVADAPVPDRRRRVARRERRDGLGIPRRPLGAGGRWRRPRSGERRADQRLGPGVFRRDAPVRVGGRLPELRDGRARSRAWDVRRQLRPVGADQGALRPGQRVPRQPEHQAGRVRRRARTGTRAAAR